jgi:hypothetical protein
MHKYAGVSKHFMTAKTKFLILIFILISLTGQCKFLFGLGGQLSIQTLNNLNPISHPVAFWGLNARIGTILKNKHLIYFSPQLYFEKDNTRISEFKLDYGYIINSNNLIGVYPLIGFSVYSETNDLSTTTLDAGNSFSSSYSVIKPKIEVGFGITLTKFFIRPFIETRYVFNSQWQANIGLNFVLK